MGRAGLEHTLDQVLAHYRVTHEPSSDVRASAQDLVVQVMAQLGCGQLADR